MGRYRTINVELNRDYRNDLNANFEQIEKDISGVNQEISRVEHDLDEKIESITGSGFLESLEAARDSANESATEANTQAGYAKNQGDYAKQQGDNAKEKSEYATLKGDFANEKAILADQAASKAESEASNLSQLKIDVVNATQGANTAATNAESATNHANTSGDYAKEQGDYAKAQGDYAKQVADDISEQAGVTSINGKRGAVTLTANDVGAIPSSEKGVPNGVAATNAEGKVVDAFGNEVEGKMKSVNHTEPDETGNVTIDVQTPADNALKAANEYTDQAIANANQGEVKMVYYPYLIKATTDNQTEFTIPLETFDAVNDFLQVVQNTTILNKEEHYTVTGKTITLNEGVATGTSIFITIIKNTLVGAEGGVNGNIIEDATMPLKKLAEKIPTLDAYGNVLDGNGNIVEGKVKTVNNTQPDENGNVVISIPTKTSELTNDSDYATNATVSEVANNIENHETEIASVTDLGHVKVDGETFNISEEGVLSINTTSLNAIPSGLISLWSGAIDSIPSGWVLCDGENNTPDLRDRFIVGAGSKYVVGAKGGQDSVILDITQIPAHQHSSGTLAANQAGSHQHSMRERLGFLTASGSGSEQAFRYMSGYEASITDAAGAHTHSISGSTANTGGGTSHENRPPFYALAYIMKL